MISRASNVFGVPSVFSVLVMVLLAANYFGPMADLDWTWQIRTGQLIVDSGTLRTPESFSYTIHGAPVHDFEWLYEVLLWAVWTVFGLGGLKFLKMTLVAIPLLLMGWRLKKEGVRWHGIALSFFVAIWIIACVWNLRALYFTTIGLLLVSGFLQDHCQGRKPVGWSLPLVMLLWGNLHPGVITGQGLLAGAVAWEWLNVRLKFNPPLSRERLRRLTIFGTLGFLATFLSPDPIDRLLYPFRPELKHPVQQYFVEMKPLSYMLESVPLIGAAVYLLGAAVLVTVLVRLRQFRGWQLALLAGLALLVSVAVRCLSDWTLVSLTLAVPQMKEILAQAARTDRRRWWVRCWLRVDCFCKRLLGSKLFRPQPAYPLCFAGILLALTMAPAVANQLPIQARREWPVAALDHAAAVGLQGRFFGSPDHGAYVGWRLGNQAKVYTDTRGFFFPPQFLEDSILIPIKGDDWRRRLERVLDEYRTDYFILDVAGPRGMLWRDLEPHVEPLYRDEQVVLLSASQVRTGLEKCALAQHIGNSANR